MLLLLVGRIFFKIALPIQMLNDVMQFGGPFFLNKLLKGIDNGVPSPVCYSYAFMMLMTMTIASLADNQQFQLVMRAGMCRHRASDTQSLSHSLQKTTLLMLLVMMMMMTVMMAMMIMMMMVVMMVMAMFSV